MQKIETDLKLNISESFKALKTELQEDINAPISKFSNEVKEIRNDMNSLKEKLIPDVKIEVNTLKTNIDNLNTLIQTISSSLKNELQKQIDIVNQDVRSKIQY